MTLFRESDKTKYERRIDTRNPLIWGIYGSDKDETEVSYIYSICAEHAIQRLNVMGFTLSKAKEQFDEGLQRIIGDITDLILPGPLENWYEEEARFLSQYTFEKWMDTFSQVIRRKLTKWTNENENEEASQLIRFVLDNDGDFLFGFPPTDIRYFLRAVLELVDPSDSIILDITELVDSGDFTGEEELAKDAISGFSEEFVASSTILILTEGSTDKEVLSQTLSLLYPHLSEYYSFPEFGTSKMEGGSPNLVRAVKAFIGSGIVNRVIAVFDNDTAAQVAMKSLEGLAIPANIVIMRYPPVAYAKNYPTIGPQGMQNMDVNRLAGSIELYFGEEILKTNGHDLTPIQWKGYDSHLGQYQGEIQNKRALQASYFEMVKRCRVGNDNVSRHDWSAMQIIFEQIFSAFQGNHQVRSANGTVFD